MSCNCRIRKLLSFAPFYGLTILCKAATTSEPGSLFLTICDLILVADLNEKSPFLALGMEQQTVYDLAEKHDSSLDQVTLEKEATDSDHRSVSGAHAEQGPGADLTGSLSNSIGSIRICDRRS